MGKRKEKILSFALAITMALSQMPATALAVTAETALTGIYEDHREYTAECYPATENIATPPNAAEEVATPPNAKEPTESTVTVDYKTATNPRIELSQTKKSNISFRDGVKTYKKIKGTDPVVITETTIFSYGEEIIVKVTPTAAGAAALRAMTAPEENQMAIFSGDTQLTQSQDVTNDSTLTFTVSSMELGIGSHTLTARYKGNNNMADHEETVDIIVNYPVWVGDKQIGSDNKGDVLGDVKW